MKYKDFVPVMFLNKEAFIRRKLQEAEKLRQKLEVGRLLSNQHALRKDKVDEVEALYTRQCRELDEYRITPVNVATALANGVPVSQIGHGLAASLAVEGKLSEIKAELKRLLVEPAIKSLAEFERENEKALRKLPKLRKVEEPPYVAPPPANEWESDALTPLQALAGKVDTDGEFDVNACGTNAIAD